MPRQKKPVIFREGDERVNTVPSTVAEGQPTILRTVTEPNQHGTITEVFGSADEGLKVEPVEKPEDGENVQIPVRQGTDDFDADGVPDPDATNTP